MPYMPTAHVAGKLQWIAGGIVFGTATVSVIEDAGWRHVAIVRRLGVWEYWINGALDASSGESTTPAAPSGTVTINSSTSEASYAYIAIYETALPNSVIMSHSHQLGLS